MRHKIEWSIIRPAVSVFFGLPANEHPPPGIQFLVPRQNANGI